MLFLKDTWFELIVHKTLNTSSRPLKRAQLKACALGANNDIHIKSSTQWIQDTGWTYVRFSYKSQNVKLKHCAKYRNFIQFPGVEILWKGTVSRKLGEITVIYAVEWIEILFHPFISAVRSHANLKEASESFLKLVFWKKKIKIKKTFLFEMRNTKTIARTNKLIFL